MGSFLHNLLLLCRRDGERVRGIEVNLGATELLGTPIEVGKSVRLWVSFAVYGLTFCPFRSCLESTLSVIWVLRAFIPNHSRFTAVVALARPPIDVRLFKHGIRLGRLRGYEPVSPRVRARKVDLSYGVIGGRRTVFIAVTVENVGLGGRKACPIRKNLSTLSQVVMREVCVALPQNGRNRIVCGLSFSGDDFLP